VNTALRVILAIWIVGYLALACAPLFSTSAGVGVVGFVGGIVLLVPWIIGIVVLAFLIWLTNPRRIR
jgi:hypothetical protein